MRRVLGTRPAASQLPVAEPAASRRNRLEGLTGLRIFAAGVVYLSHTPAPEGAPGWLQTFFASGYMGVTLFFVLSGFVLSLNYLEDLRRPTARGLWSFGVARFARVYPLYLLVLVFAAVKLRTEGTSIDAWPLHAASLQAWSGDLGVAYALNAPGWSISVEVFLYACFPLLAVGLARVRSVRALLVTAALIAASMVAVAAWFAASGNADLPRTDAASAHRWLYRMPLPRLGDFLLGVIAARLYLALRERPRAPRLGGPLAVASAALILLLMTREQVLYSAWSWDVAYALPAVVLIFGLAIAPTGRLGRVLSRPTIVLLGEASYALYLIHWIGKSVVENGRWAHDLTPMTAVYELFVLGLFLAAAVGAHLLVERPARARIRQVLDR